MLLLIHSSVTPADKLKAVISVSWYVFFWNRFSWTVGFLRDLQF